MNGNAIFIHPMDEAKLCVVSRGDFPLKDIRVDLRGGVEVDNKMDR